MGHFQVFHVGLQEGTCGLGSMFIFPSSRLILPGEREGRKSIVGFGAVGLQRCGQGPGFWSIYGSDPKIQIVVQYQESRC